MQARDQHAIARRDSNDERRTPTRSHSQVANFLRGKTTDAPTGIHPTTERENLQRHDDRAGQFGLQVRDSMTKWIALGAVGFVTLIVLLDVLSGTVAESPRSADILVIRDLDELRFTNDSVIDLHNCPVQIDGFSANVAELAAGARATLSRGAFDRALPRDEFYRRARRVTMHCYDDSNALVQVRVK